MPRAYYRPFTVTEELLGFQKVRKLTYATCVFLISGFVFKVFVVIKCSSLQEPPAVLPKELTEMEYEQLARRAELATVLMRGGGTLGNELRSRMDEVGMPR